MLNNAILDVFNVPITSHHRNGDGKVGKAEWRKYMAANYSTHAERAALFKTGLDLLTQNLATLSKW